MENTTTQTIEKSLLTQEELESFLPNKDRNTSKTQKPVVLYNFSCPNRISKEQLRSLYLLHDSFAKNLTASLPLFLRIGAKVTLSSFEQQTYIEYLRSLTDPTVAFTASMNPLPGAAILEINPTLAFSIIDQQLGGSGKPLEENRAVTEIEKRVLENFIKLIVDCLKITWQQILDIRFQVVNCETSTQLLQIVAPNEAVLTAIYDVQIGDIQAPITICLPIINLEGILAKFNQTSYSQSKSAAVTETRAILDNLSKIHFPVTAELYGTKAKLSELTKLVSGDFIRLDVPANKSISLVISGVIKFKGEIVNHNNHIAFCVKNSK
ncbi:MAG: flagellar motor switch protein FliM [Blastocatellia bacterium]